MKRRTRNPKPQQPSKGLIGEHLVFFSLPRWKSLARCKALNLDKWALQTLSIPVNPQFPLKFTIFLFNEFSTTGVVAQWGDNFYLQPHITPYNPI